MRCIAPVRDLELRNRGAVDRPGGDVQPAHFPAVVASGTQSDSRERGRRSEDRDDPPRGVYLLNRLVDGDCLARPLCRISRGLSLDVTEATANKVVY